jgi:predicted AAA+ superfamily ATPase
LLLRHAAGLLGRLAAGFYVVALIGPRQSGKTTLARRAFAGKPYVTLEDGETRALAQADPRGFLARFPEGAILDEAQRASELLSYLQGVVDARRVPGEWVVTGSQQFGLMSGITQSLAGRVGTLQLLPLAWPETAPARDADTGLEQAMWLGGYPALFDATRPGLEPGLWWSGYVQTYIERDVRQLLNVADLALFQRFVLMCAARSGQLLNLSALAADCGIAHTTARQWLTVMQASYLVTLLPPYFRNFGKRLVKMPKLYFLDTGLLCHLLRIPDAESLRTHAMRGPVFETWVVSEVLKHRFNRGFAADLYFFRDNHGVEADLLYQDGEGRLQVVELKSGATFAPEWAGAARRVAGYLGPEAAPEPLVVYGGQDAFSVSGVRAVPWRDIGMA